MKTHNMVAAYGNGGWTIRIRHARPRKTQGGGLFTRNWAAGSAAHIQTWLDEVTCEMDQNRPRVVLFEEDQAAIWFPFAPSIEAGAEWEAAVQKELDPELGKSAAESAIPSWCLADCLRGWVFVVLDPGTTERLINKLEGANDEKIGTH